MPTLNVAPIKGSNLLESVEIPDSLQVVDDPQLKLRPGFRAFRVMTPEDGDKRIVWDGGSLDQIEEAKRLFDQLVAEGLVPYRVGLDGKASAEVMAEFDPDAEEVIFLPIAMVTGG